MTAIENVQLPDYDNIAYGKGSRDGATGRPASDLYVGNSAYIEGYEMGKTRRTLRKGRDAK